LIIYLDTSGAPLSRRGYRKIPGSAPLQETLAAACIDAMGWDRKTPFISPMCGSGTPAIEAAMVAMGKAPGSLRSHFAFMSLKGYKQNIPGLSAPRVAPRQRFGVSPEQFWKEMLMEAQEAEKTINLPPIIATDISPEAVQNAKDNAYIAGVQQYITFKDCDFADTPIPESSTEKGRSKGCVFFNPEYGIRLGDPIELGPVYERIGTFMHDKCSGYTGSLITGNPELAHQVPLFYSTRVPFYNGPIDCRLFIYPNCEYKGESKPGNK
jgi:putative N6-adenine-specific DNA methylase